MMMRVAIVGRGRVGSHLSRAFGAVAQVTQVNPHSPEDTLPENVDYIIIAVSDDAIGEVAGRMTELWRAGKGSGKFPIMAHTSGSVPMGALSIWPGETGVLYPLQTFSKDRELNYNDIPFFIEGSAPETAEALENLARLVTGNVHGADSELRAGVHLAAVFACNFANALWTISDDILRQQGYSIRDMLPLIRETVEKLESLPPREAQTGPAARGDREVMARQERALAANPRLSEIYRLLSDYISSSE
ncbi:MAG: DUF2520 domain-containing protein [Muribaculaceae bacterium]|nr:DUF2520 domain-containing protein [Muribaculaceae bacterium]